jgi:hypothetical protein
MALLPNAVVLRSSLSNGASPQQVQYPMTSGSQPSQSSRPIFLPPLAVATKLLEIPR